MTQRLPKRSTHVATRKFPYLIFIGALVICIVAAFAAHRHVASNRNRLVFAVVGDSQGRSFVWENVIGAINTASPEFLLHCGDMVASGTRVQYEDFTSQTNKLKMPWYPVLGNHDIRGDGLSLFTELTGKGRYYSFLEKGHKFIALDSSQGFIDDLQMSWLMEQLEWNGPKFVFMHIPLFDPLPEVEHSFTDRDQANKLKELFAAKDVKAVFNGHVHIFDLKEDDGVPYVTSGGAGALLYAPPEEGGFHHYTLVQVDRDSVKVEAVQVDVEFEEPRIKVISQEGEKEFTLGELSLLPSLEANSSFENQFGNLRGQGLYVGVPVSTLLSYVGGIRPDQTIIITCSDGYSQEFSYDNVYPSPEWAEIQGTMLVAYEKDGAVPPDWQEGPRLIFAPPDGIYSNDDCALTSSPGQGWNVYKSAGGRWARFVSRIEAK
jgi:predicted phosphodiesterase